MVVRLLGLPPADHRGAVADVGGDDPAAGNIQAALEAGLLDAALVDGGWLNPQAPLTREEMASMLVRAYGREAKDFEGFVEIPGGQEPYPDMEAVAEWAKEDVRKNFTMELLPAVDGRFQPRRAVTRAEATVIAETFAAQIRRAKTHLATRAKEPAGDPDRGVKSLGRFKKFWNTRPVIGEWQKGGQGLEDYPEFLVSDQLTFHYRPGPYRPAVPFVDHLNLVRFLGGWSKDGNNNYGRKLGDAVEQYDLAYRAEDGTIAYRFGAGVADEDNLVKTRLDPYLNAGYKGICIVLDNTPWCFPAEAVEGSNFGQSAPPRDQGEWGDFVEALCHELVRLYGRELVETWSFRLGTEAAGQERFTGTLEEYLQFYDSSCRAVMKVLPGAKFGPYNGAGKWADHQTAVARYAKENGLRFDWIANSTYAIGRNKDPDLRAAALAESWAKVAAAAPDGDRLPREIMEYGWFLVDEDQNPTGEPGAYGAAGNFHYIVNLLGEGVTAINQWGPFDSLKWRGQSFDFLNSQGWLWSVFEYLVGGEAAELHVTAPAGTDAKNQRYKALGVFHIPDFPDTVMVSSFNLQKSAEVRDQEVVVDIPKNLLKTSRAAPPRLRYTLLGDGTDVYRRIKADLQGYPGWLAPAYEDNPNLLSSVKAMAGGDPAALQYIAGNYDTYTALMQDSLTLKDYDGALIDRGDHYQLKVKLDSPSVLVVTLE